MQVNAEIGELDESGQFQKLGYLGWLHVLHILKGSIVNQEFIQQENGDTVHRVELELKMASGWKGLYGSRGE